MCEIEEKEEVILESDNVKYCSDFDDECEDVPCKMKCWLYDKEKGMCPFI